MPFVNFMKYKFLFTLLLTIYSLTVNAQSTVDSVKLTVNNLFIAMRNAKPDIILASFADSAILQTITRDKDGNVSIRTEDFREFADFVSKQPAGKADERISFKAIHIDGDLASVWTPYQFYFDGKFSHCGVNSFQLVRINKQWKIQYLIDTRRKNCN